MQCNLEVDVCPQGIRVEQNFLSCVENICDHQQTFNAVVTHISKHKTPDHKENIFIQEDINPLEILLTFMGEKKLRLVDLFKNLDKDQSGSLEREEFIEGLKVS